MASHFSALSANSCSRTLSCFFLRLFVPFRGHSPLVFSWPFLLFKKGNEGPSRPGSSRTFPQAAPFGECAGSVKDPRMTALLRRLASTPSAQHAWLAGGEVTATHLQRRTRSASARNLPHRRSATNLFTSVGADEAAPWAAPRHVDLAGERATADNARRSFRDSP
jgi:hypothetical protein